MGLSEREWTKKLGELVVGMDKEAEEDGEWEDCVFRPELGISANVPWYYLHFTKPKVSRYELQNLYDRFIAFCDTYGGSLEDIVIYPTQPIGDGLSILGIKIKLFYNPKA